MSFASTLRPVGIALTSPLQHSNPDVHAIETPFHHGSNYLQLQRMLTRFQNLILLTPSVDSSDVVPNYDLTPLQRRVRAELYSPLPYHRTKWLQSIESARNLLLSLERQAQTIKSPRIKKETLRDLATKRQIVKRLRNKVEEIGRGVESLESHGKNAGSQEDQELLGERADVVLAQIGRSLDSTHTDGEASEVLTEGKPVTEISQEGFDDGQAKSGDRNALFDSSLRRRAGASKENSSASSETEKGTTSGFSNLAQTEKALQSHTREHEDLTSALVSMAAQLKQQSRAFQFSLSQDDTFLNRAVEGLDLNITSMEAASKNMAFLRRMSEEQGLLGRLKLYAIIFGLWIIAILLVFVGPKLRF